MIIKIKNQHKSIKPPCEFELPNFSVLTGKNGSGKTHLLEAMSDTSISEIKIDGRSPRNIKYIGFNELNPTIQERCDPNTISQFIKNVWREFDSAKQKAFISHNTNVNIQTILQKIGNKNISRFLDKTLNNSKKTIENLTEEDLEDNFDASFMGNSDFLLARFAMIFKNYHRKSEENKMNRYYQSQGDTLTKPVLNEEEFKQIHGNPPWDFVNKLLEATNIPYQVNNPIGTRIDSTFILKLKDKDEGFEIKSDDLSTGEKVLMSLALAIYNMDGDAGKPGLLLIDEPDAGLHPSMSKMMVNILNKNIVIENNIPTIITTHSPTTVIAAEGISIYQLTRGKSTPESISAQRAIELLSSDIPFLKISNERRRQVFVESKYDVQYYELLTNILARKETIPAEPIFLPAKTSSGSNCTDVIDLVKGLFNNGNDQIYGIIDWDLSNNSNGRIIVLGENTRYAIENYILDPLIMGLFFIRERKIDLSTYKNLSISTYTEAIRMSQDDAQIIVNKVLQDLDLFTENLIDYKLYNSWELKISKEFNEHQGHELEDLYKKKYLFLHKYRREEELKKDVIEKVINDYPQFTADDLFQTIKKIK